MENNKNDAQKNFKDDFYARGHWGLKIWQTVVTLVCWLLFIIPGVITGMTYVAHLTRGRYGWFFWHYPEGMMTIAFLLTVLAFACGMIAVFCLASAFIQNQRRYGLSEKWPLVDLNQNQQEINLAEKFMTQHFGPPTVRHNIRTYTVRPEHNLATDQLKEIIHGKEQD